MAEQWQDTGVDAGAEVEAAKAAAYAAFMAAPVDSAIGANPAVPPQVSRTVYTQTSKLTDGDKVKLLKVVNAAIMDAILKHIGPVSSDGSVLIDILTTDGIKKLDLRSSAISWERVTIDPSSAGLDRLPHTIVWQDNTATPALPLALWLKYGSASTHYWTKIWPISVPSQPLKSELLPLPDGVAALGNEGRWADGQHVHPLSRPSKIRYYLSDTHGTGDYTGHLLLTENPYVEASAIDYTDAREWAVFVSSPGSPSLSVWQGGVVHAHLRVKLINPQVGRTYKLYTGNGDIVYTDMIWDWTNGDRYQVVESAPTQPSVTTTYADLEFDIPVTALAAGTDGRFGLNMRLRVYVGSSEATFSNEKIVIRIGGDNASYIDTLFTPDGGFSGVHNDLDGRDAENAHPFASITPGRVQTPFNAPVTSADGLFAVPINSNFVILNGEEDLIGCSTEGWTGPGWIEVHIMSERNILKSQNPLPDGYAAFMWGSSDTGYGGDYDVQTAYADSIFRFRLTGGVWRIASIMNM
jgi:hypothetical protein